jgi:voltage-gated potassium channel
MMRIKRSHEQTTDSSAALLRQVPLFASVDEADLTWFARAARLRRLREGESIVIEGSYGSIFFLLVSGSATVSVQGKPIRALNPGDTFGEVAAATRGRRTATVTAATEVEVLLWMSWDLRALFEGNGDLAWRLATRIASLVKAPDGV